MNRTTLDDTAPDAPPPDGTTPTEPDAPDAPDAAGALLARMAIGERRALRELFRTLGPEAWTWCLRQLGQRVEAERALEEGLLRAWREASAWRPDIGPATPWVMARVRDACEARAASAPARPVRARDLLVRASAGRPPERVLRALERRVTPRRTRAEAPPGAAALALCAAALCFGLLVAALSRGLGVGDALDLARADTITLLDGRADWSAVVVVRDDTVAIRPIGRWPTDERHQYLLWLMPGDGTPRLLGSVDPRHPTSRALGGQVEGGTGLRGFIVSIERTDVAGSVTAPNEIVLAGAERSVRTAY